MAARGRQIRPRVTIIERGPNKELPRIRFAAGSERAGSQKSPSARRRSCTCHNSNGDYMSERVESQRPMSIAAIALVFSVAACASSTNGHPRPGSELTSPPTTGSAKTTGPPSPVTSPSATKQSGPRIEESTPIREYATVVGRVPMMTNGIHSGSRAAHGSEVLFEESRGQVTLGLSIRDVGGHRPDAFISHRDQAAVVSADLSASYAVWMESDSTDLLSNPWVLYSYDRSTKAVHRLAASPSRA